VNKGKLKGVARILIAEAVEIRGVMILEDAGSRFIAMPQRKKDGRWMEICYPLKERREELQNVVLKVFNQR
jgi:DNA-binding cell septation regulator SpoVG